MKSMAGKLTGFAVALGFALVTGSASATAISIGQWYEFGFGDPGTALTSGVGTVPGIGSIQVGDPAWTFDCPATAPHCKLIVTDAFLSVDQFELFDGGTSLGTTSAPTPGGTCGNDQLCALADPLYSHGVFLLAAGASYSITGMHLAGIPGAGFFIVTIPEPGTLVLIGAGLLMLVGMRRRA